MIEAVEVQEVIAFFEDDSLNIIALEILNLNTGIRADADEANKLLRNAMYKRWKMGKLLYENEELIKEKVGSQKAFAEHIGFSEGVLSNNKRGYGILLDAGAKTWDEVVALLESKGLQPTTYNFERMGRVLADPAAAKPVDRRPQAEKRLEQLIDEASDIVQKAQTTNGNVFELGKDVMKHLEDATAHIKKLNPFEAVWKSENYLNFVRNIGWDFVTETPCKTEPHHVIPSGKQRMGLKVADCFTIPVSRDTHMMLEEGLMELSADEINAILVKVMALYIIHNTK